ncbi:MAG TPA: ribonucleoside triphosphate reductase [Candidatus Portnoybacteria bacterium]|nr:ribonucleoside triphosphate reductase [Candidatus Portnoybacteria bacterium]
MIKNKITQIQKRDGRIVDFDKSKITTAIFKALKVTNEGGQGIAQRLSNKVVEELNKRFKKEEIPSVEKIQDLVEEILIDQDYAETAKAYILYRDQRRKLREVKKPIDLMDDYLQDIDWEVHENSNMAYSLQGLNNYIASIMSKDYWLERIYPPEIREAHQENDFHIHNLQTLAVYCCGWDLQDLFLKGFRGVFGKIEASPAKHFRTALGQMVNFFYTLQGEVAGANAFSSFDTLLAPFVRNDGLRYSEVKQSLQEFLYNMNVPTRVGFQTPFSNLTMDLTPPKVLGKQNVIIGGQVQKEKYQDFQEEMDMINRAFAELMIKGDAKGRVFTFPIPTYNITPDFNWHDPNLKPLWEMTAKYGIPYFANFVNSDMKSEDVRSMCCRLRLDNRELYKRGGGLFGSYPLTGSIGVVTLNMPRIGYLSKTKKEFLERVEKLMDFAEEALEIKRKTLERFTQQGLYPYTKYYLAGIKKLRGQYWANHFATIGLVGMNEALLNFMGENIASPKGKKFALQVLDFMRKKLLKYQEETGNIYNLEATPAEGTTYRLAKDDKEKYPDIIVANEEAVREQKVAPYYTNSSHLPVGYTDDLFESLELQDELQTKYSGGTVIHGFLGERVTEGETCRKLIKKVFEKYKLPYFTLTPTFSVCPHHGYITGEHFDCPKCVIKQPCEVYSRIVGYLRPIQQWNEGKKSEFGERKEFKIRK